MWYCISCRTCWKICYRKICKNTSITDIASEFRYRDPFIDENTLLILVSQSGETADTLASLRYAKDRGARILAVTNVVGFFNSKRS